MHHTIQAEALSRGLGATSHAWQSRRMLSHICLKICMCKYVHGYAWRISKVTPDITPPHIYVPKCLSMCMCMPIQYMNFDARAHVDVAAGVSCCRRFGQHTLLHVVQCLVLFAAGKVYRDERWCIRIPPTSCGML